MANTEEATRYREIKRLGAGGMATVTLAEDTVLGRLVALKRVHGEGDPNGMLRLKREALVGASLNHPNLVFVYDAQLQQDGDVVIVMEYVEGETLAHAIRSRGALSPVEAVRVLRGMASALDAIHERGIVHRDVKPANVLLGRDGAVKLADLGVADVADRTRITTSGAVVGSYSYMAAEQLDGAEPTPAMDIYALAAVAYEMLTGQKARTQSNPLALARAISTESPPDLRSGWSDAPPAAAAVLQRGMSRDPAARPASAGELVRRLASALEPERGERAAAGAAALRRATPPPTAPIAPHRGARRGSIAAVVLLAAAALAVLIVVVASLGSHGKPSSGAGTSSSPTAAHQPTTSTHSQTAAHQPTSTHSQTAAHQPTTSTHSQATAPSSHSQSSTTATSPPSGTNPASPPPPAAGGSSAGTPVAAVEQFYEAAANHQYSEAWALADPNLRSQLGGYPAFQHQMSAVRSISFHSAQPTAAAGADTATVAVRTTSVQTDRTQQCSGTAQTVRSGAAWLVDHISIACS